MSEVLSKLIAGINQALIEQFSFELFEQYGFVPINTKENIIFIALTSAESKSIVSDVLQPICDKTPKFIQISKEDFKEIIKSLKPVEVAPIVEEFIKPVIISKVEPSAELVSLEQNIEKANVENSNSHVQLEVEAPIDFEAPIEKKVDIETETISFAQETAESEAQKDIKEEQEDLFLQLGELEELTPLEGFEEILPLADLSDLETAKSKSAKSSTISQITNIEKAQTVKPLSEEEQVEKVSQQLSKIHLKSGSQAGKKIGQIFLEAGYIDEVQLVQALATCKKTKMPLSSTLYKMNLVTLDALKEVLSAQKGIAVVTSEQLNIQEKVLNILSEDFIKTNKVIPLSSDGKTLTLGMVNPDDKKALKDIVYLTGQRTTVLLLTHFEFDNCVKNFYGASKKATQEIIQQLEDENIELDIEETLWEQVERELSDSTGGVAKFVNKIITDAIDTKASDIHIEPRLANYVVRYRVFGILKQVVEIPSKVEHQIITRFKVLARMNIAEHRRPQDGTFSIKYKGLSYDFRINTLPVGSQEKVVIRVLAPAVSLSANDRDIQLVGGTPEDLEKIKKMVSCPNGVILTSGPTGSGKTTTLYSVLKSLNNPDVNITTIEDPIEIKLEGINQSQVNAKAGITFASCMRAILRQDPDIILVGEVRDYETLEVAISAALTGHLVLSTVHTNSAAATVTRLIEMGAKDYLVASTLSGVIAQRLVRKICPRCREQYFASYEEASQLFVNEEEIQEFMKAPIYKPKGCDNCDFTGYTGRLGVYEIMMITKEIKKLIALGAHDLEIEEVAVKHNGMFTLNQACLRHIKEGLTTTNEFVRVLGVASE